ncbi:MAG: IS110 family transposase [Elusimicrobiota bacterium]|nr:IS110 family transposase [Elusimicrobiota bacterium]
MNIITIVGLDVHKETIVAAVLPAGADAVTRRLTIQNTPKALEKLVLQSTATGPAEFVYEAGPCGYDAHRHITKLGHACTVIAPALTPVRPGDRVKADARDAEKLARLHRAGELTAIRVPTCEEEAARDLVRIREDAVEDLQRARHRLVKFLLRQGRIFREAGAWTQKHEQWLRGQKFEWPNLQQSFVGYLRAYDEVLGRLKVLNAQVEDLAQQPQYKELVRALMCLKGIGTLSAVTLIVEAQDFRRFRKARQFMSYVGVVSSEHSSGNRIRRGSITRAGNAHIRRVLVEAAWSSRHAGTSAAVAKRREGCPEEIVKIAKTAQDRLHRKFWRMTGRGKHHGVAVVAVARELAAFAWSIARTVQG